jgi:hypothetical protein
LYTATKREELGAVSVEDWLMLLMRILIMDYNNILFRNKWRTSYGMKEAFVHLRSLELAPPPPGLPAEQCPGGRGLSHAHNHPRVYASSQLFNPFAAPDATTREHGLSPSPATSSWRSTTASTSPRT